MRFIGVDLAWGTKATTGLAVVDASGDLCDVRAAVSDDDIVEWLQRQVIEPCVVAIDAPLVVTNPTGRRNCEKLVSHYFREYNAGCHSSNTSNPTFTDGGRAARLARRLNLEIDPQSGSKRRAIEVYPHPAMIVFFGLSTVIRYKAKRRRSFEELRKEMLRLLDHVEALANAEVPLRVTAHEQWQAIRREVQLAAMKSQLGKVEDMIDAVVCAYIAAFASARPDQVRTFGNLHDGYIVTPVTPGIAERFDASQLTSEVAG